MENGIQVRAADRPEAAGSIFHGLLRGYRFTVCEEPSAVARSLDVRERVYRGVCGYDVPIPDEYDARSWFLLAEHVASGEAVGSMRVTPRSAGALEAEEYFTLPGHLRSPRSVEITRFSTLPSHRDSKRFLPVVALGLFKLASNFVKHIRAQHLIVCSKPERVATYEWLRFRRTDLVAPYGKLGNSEHVLLTCDLRGGIARHRRQRYWKFGFEMDHPELVLPARVPALGIGMDRDEESPRLRRMG